MSVAPFTLLDRADDQALIYPGLGLGTILANATKMTDKMVVAGSNRLAELAPALKDPKKALLPEFGGALLLRVSLSKGATKLIVDAASVNFEIALAVLEQAIEEGVAQAKDIPPSAGERRKWAEEKRWIPQYQQYQYDPAGRK